MLANLSLVLDRDCKERLDILKDMELTDIDITTSSFESSDDIREEFRDKINNYLSDRKQRLVSEGVTNEKVINNRGGIVVTYQNEKNEMIRMRVLYNKDIDKTFPDKTLSIMINNMKKLSYKDIEEMIDRYYNRIFTSDFDKKILRETRNYMGTHIGEKANKSQRDKLINFIKNKMLGLIDSDVEKQRNIGYFYIRLLDSYIDKKIEKSNVVIKAKSGNIRIKKQSEYKNRKVKLVEENTYDNKTITMDTDGQYSFIVEDTKEDFPSKYEGIGVKNYYYDVLNMDEDREFSGRGQK